MSRKFLVPIVLPADPTVALEAATKQYVDGKAGGGGFKYTQDTAPPTPAEDETWFNTVTGASYVWINDGTSSQWVQFAPGAGGGIGSGKPRGVVAYAQVTTDQNIATTAYTELAGMSVTWVADPTRYYRTTVFFLASSTVSNDDMTADIVDAAGNRKQLFPTPYLDPNSSMTMYASLVETGLSGTTTRKVRANRAGTGTMTIAGNPTYPRYIMVEDITNDVSPAGLVAPTLVRLHRFNLGTIAPSGGLVLVTFTAQDLLPLALYKVTTFIRAARVANQGSFIWQTPSWNNIPGMEWWFTPTVGYTSMTAVVFGTGAAMNLGSMRLLLNGSGAELYLDVSSTVTIEQVHPNAAGVPTGTPI